MKKSPFVFPSKDNKAMNINRIVANKVKEIPKIENANFPLFENISLEKISMIKRISIAPIWRMEFFIFRDYLKKLMQR